jgi:hypothetical protein
MVEMRETEFTKYGFSCIAVNFHTFLSLCANQPQEKKIEET